MKVAIITLEYPPHIIGGAGIYLQAIVPELVRLGHEVHVIAPGTAMHYGRTIEQGAYIHRLPVSNQPRWKTVSFWAAQPRLFRHVEQAAGGFALVHSNGPSDLLLRRSMAPRPRLVTVHHLARSSLRAVRPSLRERLRQPGHELGLMPHLELFSIRRADHIVAVSEATRHDLIATGIPAGPITVIRHGARVEDYRFDAVDLQEIRARFGLGADPLVLSVGRLEPRKGTHVLLRAFALVHERRPVTLALVGSGDQGPYRTMARESGIAGRVRFLGHVDAIDLRKLYAACDLLALPSLMEGLGLVALEARAAGKRVVASRVGGIPEVVPPGAGHLVPPGDPGALAQALLRALGEPRQPMPAAPTWADAARQLSRLYQRVAEGRDEL